MAAISTSASSRGKRTILTSMQVSKIKLSLVVACDNQHTHHDDGTRRTKNNPYIYTHSVIIAATRYIHSV